MPVPEAINDLRAVADGNSANLAWTNPNDGGSPITGYRIERNLNNGGFVTLVANTASGLTTYVDSRLVARDSVAYRVSAINGNGTGSVSNNANATITKEKTKTVDQASWITYVIALFVGVANFVIILTYGLDSVAHPEVSIALVGIVTFFGVLVISAHHNHANAEDQRKHATGTMRRAMAASILLVYIITFSISTFGDFQEKTIETSQTQITEDIKDKVEQALQNNASTESITNIINSTLTDKLPQLQGNLELELSSKTTLLGHFTTVTSLVVVFYFGSKALENWYGKKEDPLNKKLLKKSIADIIAKLPANTDSTKKDLEDLSKTLG